jgi:hypothetical protein
MLGCVTHLIIMVKMVECPRVLPEWQALMAMLLKKVGRMMWRNG